MKTPAQTYRRGGGNSADRLLEQPTRVLRTGQYSEELSSRRASHAGGLPLKGEGLKLFLNP